MERRPGHARQLAHGYRALYAGSYPQEILNRWAQRLCDFASPGRDVYVYFNNDTAAAAPADAAILRSLLKIDNGLRDHTLT